MASELLLSPRFLAPVSYYAAMCRYDKVAIDCSAPFNKREKELHRTVIADANGTATITVPISKPQSMSRATWKDILVSDHNHWWNEMTTALRSAYGRTPFFEFYFDDFAPLLSARTAGKTLLGLNTALDTLLRRLLLIETSVEYIYDRKDLPAGDTDDFRHRDIDFISDVDYYQLRASRHGFQPGLSIVDLLFNMGPEAAVVLRQMSDR